jgi:hypothetical protein
MLINLQVNPGLIYETFNRYLTGVKGSGGVELGAMIYYINFLPGKEPGFSVGVGVLRGAFIRSQPPPIYIS